MENNFIINLPSDTFSEIHQENTISHYKTDFKIPFVLSNNYQCGLVEIIYPSSVRNIPTDINIYLRYNYKKVNQNVAISKFTIKSGNYVTVDELFFEIETNMRSITSEFIEEYFKKLHPEAEYTITLPIIELKKNFIKLENGKVIIKDKLINKIGEVELYWTFDDTLHYILGYQESDLKKPEGTAKYPVDIYGSNHALYVYTNIIKESFVGNQKSQILRIIPLEKNINNDQVIMKSKSFNPILFFPLRMHSFDMIEIEIRDATGRYIVFESGRVIVTLMFKKIN